MASFFICIWSDMDKLQQIHQLLEPLLDNGRFYVVDLKLSSNRRNPTLTLLIDTDAGIEIEDCATISRALGEKIEEAEIFDTPYQFEVSSPGVDTPINTPRQYTKNIGRTIKFLLHDNKELVGKLIQVADNEIEILEEVTRGKLKVNKKETTKLALDSLKQGIVQVNFNDLKE